MAESVRSLSGSQVASSAHRDPFADIVGESLAIRAAIALARRVAEYPATTVLLHGETGTGKELFSRGIHDASTAQQEPFVSVNCAAIPESLLESELFGHERGAFTDARAPKAGLLEMAGRGTMFLDEVDQLPLTLQPKLLRVLEERRMRRLGGVTEIPIRCRLIVATNSDLSFQVASGRFREDLYYRLNVFRIELPPLRMREQDVDLLAHSIVQRMCESHGLTPRRLTPESVAVLRLHPWPGNIRELKNTVERAVIVSDGAEIRPEHIVVQKPVPVTGAPAPVRAELGDIIDVPAGGLTVREAERALYAITERLARGNHSLMARMLGVSRPTVLRRLREFEQEQ